MPYEIDVSSYGLPASVPIVGWFAAIPFDFSPPGANDPGGKLQAQWSKLLVLAHLATDAESSHDFRQVSRSDLATAGTIKFATLGGRPPLTANQVEASQIWSQQTICTSDSVWIFRGVGDGTSLTWSSPQYPFADWDQHDHNHFGWSGSLNGAGGIAKLSYARVDWRGSQYFRAVEFAGPSGPNGTNALAATILNCFVPSEAGIGQPGTQCTQLTLNDPNRGRRTVPVLGTTPNAVAQIQNAHGALWLAHGSFANLRPRELLRMVRLSHQQKINLDFSEFLTECELVDEAPLASSMHLGSGQARAQMRTDVVFEGLSLWNLSRRGAQTNDPPVLL